jgi:hypothetical protein
VTAVAAETGTTTPSAAKPILTPKKQKKTAVNQPAAAKKDAAKPAAEEMPTPAANLQTAAAGETQGVFSRIWNVFTSWLKNIF